MKKKKPPKQVFTIRFDAETVAELREFAKKRGVSTSKYLRGAVAEFLLKDLARNRES